MEKTKAIKKLKPEDLKCARRAGFRRKKPKKGSIKTITQYNAFAERYNSWADAARAKAKEWKQKEAEKKKVKSLKSGLQGL